MAKKTKQDSAGNVATMEAPAANNTTKAPAPRKNLANETQPKVLGTFLVSPAKLKHNDKLMGRVKPVSPEEVARLADSIREYGQEQPLRARPIRDTDEYEVIFGNTRAAAGRMIVEGYNDTNGKPIAPAPDFKLRVEVVEMEDEEAFASNVVENAARFKTSPLDDAYNQKRLREDLQMSDVAIAKLYGHAHSAGVNRLKKIIDPENGLDEGMQQTLHDGGITIDAALQLLTIPKEDRQKVWLAALDKVANGKNADEEEKKVGGSAMLASIKEYHKAKKEAAGTGSNDAGNVGTTGEDGTNPATATGSTGESGESGTDRGPNNEKPAKLRQMTVKEFKDELETAAKHPQCPANLATVVEATLSLIENKIQLEQWTRNVIKVLQPDDSANVDEAGNAATDTLGDYTEGEGTKVLDTADPTA